MAMNADEISKHYSAQPNFYELDKVPVEALSDKISRQFVMDAKSMLVKWTLKKGALIPLHFHASEQITWITQGSVKVTSQGKEFVVKAGGVLILPSFTPHEFLALEDTIDIDFFTPVREDWINNTANYLQNNQKK
jgi:quercetin dioxygenase-like cupin family protein